MMFKQVLVVIVLLMNLVFVYATKGDYFHSSPTANCQDVYGDLLDMSYMFYEAQQSGYLPDFNRVPWRKDSALNDSTPNGQDLTGGWYDAGDHLKFVVTSAYTVHKLVWGILEFPQGYQDYKEVALNNILFAVDFLRKAMLNEPQHPEDLQFAVQVGDAQQDHSYWGRPEDMYMQRPVKIVNCSFPGSEPAALTSAAFSALAILLDGINATYAQDLLQDAELLYQFGSACQGKWTDSVFKDGEQKSYPSRSFEDELALAAAWLYKATNNSIYLYEARQFYNKASFLKTNENTDWDNNYWAALMTLLEVDSEFRDQYDEQLNRFLNEWMNPTNCPQTPQHDWGLCRTPKGLSFMGKWGSLRDTMNAAFLAMVYSKNNPENSKNLQQFAKNQIDYIINGDFSYVIGHGFSFPQKPHHRSSSCPVNGPCDRQNFESKERNPQTLYGALVGGPSHLDNYVDDREDFVQNAVAIDHNAGYTGVLAALRENVVDFC